MVPCYLTIWLLLFGEDSIESEPFGQLLNVHPHIELNKPSHY